MNKKELDDTIGWIGQLFPSMNLAQGTHLKEEIKSFPMDVVRKAVREIANNNGFLEISVLMGKLREHARSEVPTYRERHEKDQREMLQIQQQLAPIRELIASLSDEELNSTKAEIIGEMEPDLAAVYDRMNPRTSVALMDRIYHRVMAKRNVSSAPALSEPETVDFFDPYLHGRP